MCKNINFMWIVVLRRCVLLLFLVGFKCMIFAQSVTDYVNVFIGTSSFNESSLPANTYPGATVPFGMVQLSPDTQKEVLTMCSGYYYNDINIYGFSHTHASGTGIADLLDISLLPISDNKDTILAKMANKDKLVYSRYRHETEKAFPGYYKVYLDDYNIDVELTATQHVGVHKYTYFGEKDRLLALNLDYGITKTRKWFPLKLIDGFIKILDEKTVWGYRIVTGWGRLRKIYFAIKFSEPLKKYMFLHDGVEFKGNDLVETSLDKPIRALFQFASSTKSLDVRVGLSTVSSSNALLNINEETSSLNFKEIQDAAKEQWENVLSKIEVKGTDKQKVLFYSALYRTMQQPNNIADVNGEYTRGDFTLGRMPNGGAYYSQFSLWDTYRAVHPLYTLIQPERVPDFINSMLDFYDTKGILPIWQIWGVENFCMIGNHALPIIADAYSKDIKGIDYKKAYLAMKQSALTSHPYTSYPYLLDKYGYYPHDANLWESVSSSLETSFDDWCVYLLSLKYGSQKEQKYFSQRAELYRNLYDKETGFFRPRLKNGKFVDDFSPFSYYGDGKRKYYTEGNAFHYQFNPIHSLDTLIMLMGGKKGLEKKLDAMFTLKTPSNVTLEENASGFIGQYVHGNEPCHHYAYLYNYTNSSFKTQKMVRRIIDDMYDITPNGLSGNDDCGQMSAWLVFSMMGFYPLNPAIGEYEIGTPSFPYVKINNPNGTNFIIKAHNVSDKNKFIKEILLNGKIYKGHSISHKTITSGGVIEFFMTSKE